MSFLHSKRWLGYWALFIVFSVGCVLLGNWQFERRAQAQAEIQRIDQNYDAAARDLGDVVSDPTLFDEDAYKWQPVFLQGTYLQDSILVRNRPHLSQVGYEILSPLRLQDGTLFIVNRGWLPLSETGLADVEIPAPPSGQVEVVARLKAGEPVISDRAAVGNTIGTINLPELQQRLDQPMFTGAYGLLVSESPSAPHGELSLRPERDEGPHLSYALQWYVFIVVAAGGLLLGARNEYLANGEARIGSGAASPGSRRPSRRRTDADDEDALLDALETRSSAG